jgi:hypothetical protein
MCIVRGCSTGTLRGYVFESWDHIILLNGIIC